MRAFFVVFTLLLFVSPSSAKDVAGVALEDKIANADGKTLQLNGAGERTKFFMTIYVASLYLENLKDDAAQVLADDGAKRVMMHFLYKEVGKDKIVESWNEGFAANTSPEALGRLKEQIAAFNAMFTEDMKAGDVMFFDYLPGQGTQVTVKGEVKGLIEGKEFNDALLSIWLGPKPISTDLKKALLRQ